MNVIIPAANHGACLRRAPRGSVALLLILGVAFASAGCQLSQASVREMTIHIEADGRDQKITVPAGSTVGDALQLAGITLGNLDRTEPPSYALLQDAASVRLIRVEEHFRTEVTAIPFDRQVLRNESLPEGEERLVQIGINGREELTYRTILENGARASESIIKRVTVSEPTTEIVMIGARSALSPIAIPGRLAYLSGGNAWIMETSTGSRRLLVNSADLDGRVFVLSADGSRLLYTRRSAKPADAEINTLWSIGTDPASGSPAQFKVSNVLHFADWYPGSAASIAFSTVEPRSNAPGWQANNDLYKVSLGGTPGKILDAQSGGIYGWWGTMFAFSPNGRLAYSRPDSIGLVSQDGGYLAPLAGIAPLQTHSDWAWLPGIAWGPDSEILFYVDHAAGQGATSPEDSPIFNLQALSLTNNATVTLAENVGMFASPSASGTMGSGPTSQYEVAFLQAIFPEQSDVSRYRVVVIDRDGSNRRELFPGSDVPGLEPQRIVWAPAEVAGQTGPYICVVYQGNLWFIDSTSGQARQVTNDGLISEVDWK